MRITIGSIYRGSRSYLGERQAPTGIKKAKFLGATMLSRLGIEDDFIGDRVVHGGPEKAVHHFPADHFEKLSEAFPQATMQLLPGSIGENISSYMCTEHNVRISDILSLGGAILQVSQPRKPCWKIDAKYGCIGIANRMYQEGLCGWYYRVIQEGMITSADELELVERQHDAPTLKEFQSVTSNSRPDPEMLESFARVKDLSNGLAKQLTNRAKWLRSNTTRN